MADKIYNYRFLTKIVIQAKTPLAVGSGEKDVLTDRVVTKDVNGLPYIPGSSIAGILRNAIGKDESKTFFGFNEKKEERDKRTKEQKDSGKSATEIIKNIDEGSKIIFSSAQLIDEDGKVVEGLVPDMINHGEYLHHFKTLPARQHVRISDNGTTNAKDRGKYDEEIVYKGTRFCFEIEMLSENNDETALFQKILTEIASDTIRIGSGSRKGFGEILVVECKTAIIDLFNPKDLTAYIDKTSSLNDSFWTDKPNIVPLTIANTIDWSTYKLELHPDDFFLFSSGFGNEKANITPVSEDYIEWIPGNKPKFIENAVLIPASSVKGALSHRVAYHYNKIKKYYAGDPEARAKVGDDNLAVQTLFGYNGSDKLFCGNVLISDVIQAKKGEQLKILNHVSIDRFTGGSIDGALFDEEVLYGKGQTYVLTFKVRNKALYSNEIKKAFEYALLDIADGMLPLGGGTNRGHGCFNGIVYKNLDIVKR
jgi:CRISPR type III-B/RAMP module RAMP protein Cmr6